MKVEKKFLGSSGISQQCLQRILDGKKNNKVRLRSGNRHKHGKLRKIIGRNPNWKSTGPDLCKGS